MTIALTGCCPEPLGSYLKALGVLRLISEQDDSQARGWWDGACFHLESRLDEEEAIDFFLKSYQPTPIIAPWNGGSGFYPKDRKIGIDAIAGSGEARFATYREAIEIGRGIDEVKNVKGVSKKDEDARREAILLACRNRLPDAVVDWLDAAVGMSSDGSRAFAPILGTGGNEGRLDYTNNFMENLKELLIQPSSKTPIRDLLKNALWGTATSGFDDGSVGQYDPGRAGGPNQGSSLSNPWNFVLTLEGAVSWAAGLYRRQGISYRSFLCSPFTVKASPVGYGSASQKDKDAARAEVWTPLWKRPTRYSEIKSLLREGRATVELKPAETGLEFAEAVSMLQVDRGLSGFVRYQLLKRRGDSYIALPAGRFTAGYRENAELFREVPGALRFPDKAFRDSSSYQELRRQVDQAIYDALLRDSKQEGLRDVAAAMGRLVRWILTTQEEGRPHPRLSRGWIDRLQDANAPEARVAAALAGIYDHQEKKSVMVNLDRSENQFAWLGNGLSSRMHSVLERRVLTANSNESKTNPVGSSYEARLADVERFLDADVDEDLIEDLLFCFLLVREKAASPEQGEIPTVWPVYALFKHLFLPRQLENQDGPIHLRADLTVLSLLRNNQVEDAAVIAIRRLQAAKLNPLEAKYAGGIDGPRLAASLLIPVEFGPYQYRLVRRMNDPKSKDNR